MNSVPRQIVRGSQIVSYLLGIAVLGLTAVVAGTSLIMEDIGKWLVQVLGYGFIALLVILVTVCLLSWLNIRKSARDEKAREIWVETGVHAANGVTTLALTCTLYGISLGIGALATQDLTPETVQSVIRDLTGNFSLAFMTTVIGLPVSAFLRALVLIEYKRGQTFLSYSIEGD